MHGKWSVNDEKRLENIVLQAIMRNTGNKSENLILRQQAEELLKIRQSNSVLPRSEAEMLKLIHELEVHQIELELQNDELNESLFQANHSVMLLIDPETGDIKDANPVACRFYGWSHQGICSKNISDINVLSQADILAEMALAKTEKRNYFIFKHRLADGEIRDVEVYSGPVSYNNSTILYSNVHDISNRKKAEEKLRKSESKYRKLVETINDVLYEITSEGILKYVSPSVLRVLGFTPDEVLGKNIISFIHPEDRQMIFERVTTLALKDYFYLEYRYINKSGETCWVRSSTTAIVEDGKLVGGTGTLTDITDRKLAENDLNDKNNLLTNLIINLQEGILLEDSARKITLTNQQFCDMFSIPASPEVMIGADCSGSAVESKHFFKNPEKFIADINLILANKEAVFNDELQLVDGRYFERDYIPTYHENKYSGHLWKYRDITQRKQIEEALSTSEMKYRNLVENINDVIFEVDLQGIIKYIAPSIEKIVGYSANELIGQHFGNFVGENFEIISERLFTLKENDVRENEYKISTKYGQPCYVRLSTKAIFKNGKFAGGSGTLTDITDRKLAEERLIKLSQAVEQSPVMNCITDLKGSIEYVNPKMVELTGYSQDELIGSNPRIFSSGQRLKEEYRNLYQTISSGIEWKGEFHNKKKSGELFWVSASISPVIDSSGKITHYLAVEEDITDRKKIEKEIQNLNSNLEYKINERTAQLAEKNKELQKEIEERKNVAEALIKSENNYRSVVENVHEIIFQTDTEGLWVFLNKELFVNYVHPDDRARNWELFEPLISRKKEYCRHEIRYLTKDGEFRWIEVFARLGLNENDEITGTYGTLMDITERKLVEESLLWNQSLLQLMSNSSPLGFLVVDNRTDNILYFNQRFCQIWGIEHLAVQMKNGELRNNDIIPYCLPALADITDFVESCKPLQYEDNRIVIEDEIAFTENRTVRRYSTQIRGEHDEYFGRFYIFEDITERKRAEDFENELLQLSPTLTGLPLSKIKDAIDLALRRIGQFLKADRSYLFEFDATHQTMSNTHEWCSTGIDPEIENLQHISYGVLPRWMETLQRHENIVIDSVKDLPESWSAEREILEPQGIKSLIVIPLLAENTLIGFVGLDSVVERKEYKASEINILKVWSSMLASLINDQRFESILEQTRLNYETFFNTIDDFLFVLDEQGNIIHTNNTVNNRLEYSIEELLGKSVLMVHPIKRREEAGRIVGEMLAGTADFCPVPLQTKSGTDISVETKVKPGYWNGKPVIFGVSKDVSQIKISEEKFSKAFHSSSALMSISGFADGVFIEVNDAFIGSLGYNRDELIEKTSVQFDLFVDSFVRRKIYKEIKQKKKIREIEIKIRTKSGEILLGLFSADLIYISNKQCLLTLFVDITERKKVEEELKKARIEAEKANLAKSEFLSRMSHELRTPMNSILGFAQLLDMGELSNGQRKGVTHIMKSGRHLLDLINEVLEISRIEAGRLSLSIEPVQLSGAILEMIDIVKLQANERNIKLELNNTPSNQLFVKADKQRLKQIVLNLLNNAIKYNRDSGSVMVQVELQKTNTFGLTMVRISIIDTGLGISAEDLPKLFNPFVRIGAEKSEIEGTGLGLSVVKKLVDAMGGVLGVESKIEVGSTFWIEFPYSESQLENAKKLGGFTSDESKLVNNSGTILYIEDNASNIELVEQILTNQRSDLRLVTNISGKHAVQLAINCQPNLILLDLDLPDIHGSEVLQLLLDEERTKNIPVVVISADAIPRQMNKLLKAGAKHYLTKPLNIIDFLKMIDEFMIN